MTKATKSEPQRPTYAAYHVTEPRPGKKRWTRIGAFFAHEDGQGGTLILEAIPIAFDGHVVLRTPKPQEQAEEARA
jgi:hypothetical protein